MTEVQEWKAGIESAATVESGAVGAGGFGFFDGTLIKLLRSWLGAGMSVGSFWTWIPVILQLVQVLGPEIQKIIQIIRDAINGNKTPSDVLTEHPMPA